MNPVQVFITRSHHASSANQAVADQLLPEKNRSLSWNDALEKVRDNFSPVA